MSDGGHPKELIVKERLKQNQGGVLLKYRVATGSAIPASGSVNGTNFLGAP